MTFIASDRSGHYQTLEPVTREQIIRFAHSLLTRQFRNRRKITSSEDVRQWLVMKLALENRESFGVIMLSQQHHSKRTARAVLTGTGYSVCRVTRHGNSSLT